MTRTWNVEILIGADGLKFGMSPSGIRSVVGAPVESFMKTPTSGHPTDAFDSEGLHVYYDKEGQCEAIEFFSPAKVLLNGTTLSGQPYEFLVKRLRSMDPTLEEEDDCITSHSLGIGAFASGSLDDPTVPVEGIIVFRKGYYD